MNTDRLAELAAEATAGPWKYVPVDDHGDEGDIGSPSDRHKPLCRGHDNDDYGDVSDADAAYIAAVSPDVVLRLIAVVRAAAVVDRTVSPDGSYVPHSVQHYDALAALRAALREVSE